MKKAQISPMLPKKKVTNNKTTLIVGLGNPGEKYESTRHNIGFSFIDKFSEQIDCPIIESKFNSLYSSVNQEDRKLLLLKPQTYMNESGVAVKKVKDFFKISSNQTIVIYDDLDLQVGQIKIKDDVKINFNNNYKAKKDEKVVDLEKDPKTNQYKPKD